MNERFAYFCERFNSVDEDDFYYGLKRYLVEKNKECNIIIFEEYENIQREKVRKSIQYFQMINEL